MLSKSQARLFFLGGTALFSAAFIGLTIDSMKQVPKRTNDASLTESTKAGKRIWEENNCMGCHTLFGEGAYYAPELTKAVERRGKPWLRLFLKDPQAMFPGERKMVQYDFTPEEIEHVIDFLEWCGNVDLNGFPAPPPLKRHIEQVVTSSGATIQAPETFKTICAACHAIAGVGGAVGPALDGIHLRKNRDELRAWISDPQTIKPGTAMPRIPMAPEELERVLDYLLNVSAHAGSTPPTAVEE